MAEQQLTDEFTASESASKPPRLQLFKTWYLKHKKLSIPLSVTIGILFIGALIYTITPLRYGVLAPFVSRSVTIQVLDSSTKSPIHDAEVMLGSKTVKTTTKGIAEFNTIPVGPQTLDIKKSMYDTQQATVTVPVFGDTSSTVLLKANGRRVTITITDRLNGQPIDGATITAGKSSGASKADGKAEIVVPIAAVSLTATLSKEGYLPDIITLTKDTASNAQLVKTGRMYFLSKQSGTVDVISANLDGSDRKTILKGTGNEDDRATSLLASRDWRYLMLQAKRDTTRDALYLIDTQNPTPIRITSGDTFVTSVGWSSHRFVYQEYQPYPQGYADSANWKLLSVRASDKTITTLEKVETIADQWGNTSYQYIGTPYILDDDTVVYASYWNKNNYYADVPTGHQSGVISVQADGSNRRFIKAYPSQEISYIETKLYKPQEIHYRVYNTDGERRENIMTINKKIEIVPPAQQKFDQDYPTFLISPDDKRAFWAEPRDGKNTLFIGDNNAGSSEQLATLSEYTPYGWFTDDYVLLQKSNSELYVTSIKAIKSGSDPLKISDYHKPANNFAGYGYGYGGQ